MGLLRVILAITVVIAHSNSLFGFKFVGGLVAVEVFFIVSGFYMTMVLDSKYTGRGSYKIFLSNRFLRLYPMYWAVLFLTILVSIVSFILFGKWGELFPYIKYINMMAIETLFFQIATNLVLLGQDVVMFLGMNRENGEIFLTSNFRNTNPMFCSFLLIPQAWSLGIEVMFYLIAPLIVRKSNSFIIATIIVSLSIRAYTYFYLGYIHDPWTYRFFPSELALFLFGTISYRIHKSWEKMDFFNQRNLYAVSAMFFTILIFYQFLPLNNALHNHLVNWSFYFLACFSLPFIFELSKSSLYDRRIGELSYPIYLSHILVIFSLTPFIIHFDLDAFRGEFSVFLTVVVSYLLVRAISDPIEKVRHSRITLACHV